MAALLAVNDAAADEGGASFWLPGQYGSFAAMPANPGWALETIFYHGTASAKRNIGFQRGGGLQLGYDSPSTLVMMTPTYTLEELVLGARASISLSGLFGKNSASATATLTGPGGNALSGSHSDRVVGFGDLSPTASLSWSRDVHNVMIYTTAGIPIGAYNTARLSSLGLGFWSVDAGAGYTYYDEKAGIEWSIVSGLTYNFINPYTQYQSGVSAHVDWSISPYVTDKMLLGAVGYFYNQITDDTGPGAVNGFRSRVAGIGPQIGFFVGDTGFVSIKAFHEFNAKNRPDGWSAWLSFSIETPEK